MGAPGGKGKGGKGKGEGGRGKGKGGKAPGGNATNTRQRPGGNAGGNNSGWNAGGKGGQQALHKFKFRSEAALRTFDTLFTYFDTRARTVPAKGTPLGHTYFQCFALHSRVPRDAGKLSAEDFGESGRALWEEIRASIFKYARVLSIGCLRPCSAQVCSG